MDLSYNIVKKDQHRSRMSRNLDIIKHGRRCERSKLLREKLHVERGVRPPWNCLKEMAGERGDFHSDDTAGVEHCTGEYNNDATRATPEEEWD